MYRSADLFRNSSVLACICNPPAPSNPQSPISHYCHTLQSPILQFAMYLYCRVHLAFFASTRKGQDFRVIGHIKMPQGRKGLRTLHAHTNTSNEKMAITTRQGKATLKNYFITVGGGAAMNRRNLLDIYGE